MDKESKFKENLKDYDAAADFLDEVVEDFSNYVPSDNLDEFLDEILVVAEHIVNVESEMESSNVTMVDADDEVFPIICKFLHLI
jgi:hypothetical protein